MNNWYYNEWWYCDTKITEKIQTFSGNMTNWCSRTWEQFECKDRVKWENRWNA